jgi:hypothetical protein
VGAKTSGSSPRQDSNNECNPEHEHGSAIPAARLAGKGVLYGWFTEGFDPADLKDAKALLEELS